MLTMLLLGSSLAGQGLSFYKVYLFHILLIFSLFKNVKFEKLKLFLKNEKSLVYMAVFPCLTLFWSTSISLGLRDISYMLMGIIFIFLVGYSKLSSKDLIKVVCWVTWINLFISVGEALDIFRFPVSQFSTYASFFGKKYLDPALGASVPTGFHSNPNNNALFFVVFSPIVLTTLNGWKTAIFLLLTTFVLFMATSKLMLVAWFVLLAIILFGFARKKLGSMKALFVFTSLLLLVVCLFSLSSGERIEKYSRTIPSLATFAIKAPQNLLRRLSGEEVKFDYMYIDRSLHWRLTYLDGIASILHEKWLFGAGAGSLDAILNEQAGIRLSMKNPHFYFLEIAAKFGFIFLFIYLFWIFRVCKNVTRVNGLYGLSMIVFILFNPVIASAVYFLPKWGLYGLMLKISNESISKHSY